MQQATEMNAASSQHLPAVLNKLEHCLRKGCFFCIEHIAHGNWTRWAKPSCYNGDLGEICNEIERCREHHSDKAIRLNIEDFTFRSRFTVMVQYPAANEA